MKITFFGGLLATLVLTLVCISPNIASADDESLLPCTITSFKAVPASITSGASSSLKWVTQNCITNLITQDSNPVISSALPSGSVSTGLLTSTKTYLLTAVGDTNSATAYATVTVGTIPACSITTFTANPSSIQYNTTSTLSWTTNNCTSVSISPTIGTVPVNGSVSTGNLTQTTIFTLNAVSGSNAAIASKTITVIPAPQCTITLFNATPQNIIAGQSTLLNWKTTNCNTGSINQGIGSITSTITQGSVSTGVLMSTKTYKLTAEGIANTASAQTTVSVALSCVPNSWTQKADFGGTARYDAITFVISSKGYLGTGSEGYNEYQKDFWEYDPVTNTWTQKADFAGLARDSAVSFTINNKAYVGTGNGLNGVSYKDFWEYNPTSNTWTQKADFGGTARSGAVGFSINNKGYVGTGTGGAGQKDFWEYNPTSNTWTQKADFGGTGRYEAIGFAIGSKGYLGTGFGGGFKKDFWEYNPTSNIWTQKADFGGTARYHPVAFTLNSKGYVGTGHDVTTPYLKDFWEYNPSTNAWTQKADFGGTGRHFAKGFAVNGKGYIGIGEDSNWINTKDFWEYCP